MSDLLMPSLAEGLEEATISRWLKRDGDAVAAGDELLEIETDKVTMVHTAETPGILEIVVPEGSSVPVGAVVARLAEPVGDDGAARRPAVEQAQQPAILEDEAPAREVSEAPAAVAVAEARPAPTSVRATPLARLLAGKHGIDLAALTGSGPYGLVTRTDVTGEAPAGTAGVTGPVTTPARSRAGDVAETTLEPLSRLQQVIARRMVEAKTTVPEFQVQTEAAVDTLLALREQIKGLGDVPVPSVNDLVIKAAALALREHPRVNGSYRDDGFLLHHSINVGFAVAAADALIVPTIRDADRLSVLEIAAETRRLAERARSGSFTPEDITGGTFTVSNLGMFGMTAITPIINVPQAAILGVAAARAVPYIDDEGNFRPRSLMTLTLSCDHRILYGADAARFLSLVRTLLEEPLRLTLDATPGE
jgi:pyruvate dehydrogenase E2 component (dihydrolipoamide acetyltransferase)